MDRRKKIATEKERKSERVREREREIEMGTEREKIRVTLVGQENTNRINFNACDRFKSISMRATAKHKSLLD